VTGPSRQCVILAGGLGARLGNLTKDVPKPLLDVDGRPFLFHLMRNARRFGFTDFVLLAGYRGERVSAFAAAARQELGADISVIVEPEAAGTAGALLHASEELKDEFLMLNGDSLFSFNFLDLAARPVEGEWLARLALRRVADASRYGSVEVAGDRVRAYREKSAGSQEGLINGGVYWMRRGVLDFIKRTPCSLECEVFPDIATRGALRAFEYDGPFIDIGVPDDLDSARERWSDITRAPATFFDRDGVLNHDAGYTHRIEDFRWIEGARESIKRCNDEGRFVFVVTNQAGVARGYYDEQAIQRLHAWMNEDLRLLGAHIDDFRYCPHHPEGVVPAYTTQCGCRKPKPGMINSLLQEWPVDLASSVFVGDKESDLEAAAAAGLKGLLFHGQHFPPARPSR